MNATASSTWALITTRYLASLSYAEITWMNTRDVDIDIAFPHEATLPERNGNSQSPVVGRRLTYGQEVSEGNSESRRAARPREFRDDRAGYSHARDARDVKDRGVPPPHMWR